jgi:hypothetical protein
MRLSYLSMTLRMTYECSAMCVIVDEVSHNPPRFRAGIADLADLPALYVFEAELREAWTQALMIVSYSGKPRALYDEFGDTD